MDMNNERQPELLDGRQLWKMYGLSIPWQRRARREGRGPKYLKIGRIVRYRRRDVEAFLDGHEVNPKKKHNKMNKNVRGGRK